MTGRERIVAVLEHRLPDRVPVAELWIDPSVARALCPGKDSHDLADHLDLDMVGAYTMIYEDDEVEWVDREHRIFRDKWGVIRAFGPESTPAPVEGPIKRPEDLKTYTPPDPEAPDVLGSIPEIVARYKGKKAITALGRDAATHVPLRDDADQFPALRTLNHGRAAAA